MTELVWYKYVWLLSNIDVRIVLTTIEYCNCEDYWHRGFLKRQKLYQIDSEEWALQQTATSAWRLVFKPEKLIKFMNEKRKAGLKMFHEIESKKRFNLKHIKFSAKILRNDLK